MTILELLFKKNMELEDIFSENLYISFDKNSALRMDYYKVLDLIKVSNIVEIVISKEKKLPEKHKEYLCIIQTDIARYFTRIIIINDKYISDVLVYSINNEDDFNKYKNIFFKEDNEQAIIDFITKDLPKDLSIRVIVKYDKNHLKLIGKTADFLEILGYEDWDYNNKFENYLDSSIVKDDYELLINNLSRDVFTQDIKFICNGGKIKQILLRAIKRNVNGVPYYILEKERGEERC